MAITAYLYYEDVDRALKFLAGAFGFKNYGVQMSRPDGKIYHAAMKFGDGLIMLGRPESAYRNPKGLGHTTQSLYIDVKNVDKHFQRARKSGATVIEEPIDTEYGHRRYRVTDPEGHEWCFAQNIRRQKSKPERSQNR